MSNLNTLWDSTESPQKVSGLTVLPIRVLQHAEQKSKFTGQTIFAWASLRDMRLGERPEKRSEEQDLKERVAVRVGDMCLQSTKLRFVIEPMLSGQMLVVSLIRPKQRDDYIAAAWLTQNQSPRHRTCCT